MNEKPLHRWKAGRMFDPAPAVRWLSPNELARSALHLIVATTFGDYADRRESMAAIKASTLGDLEPEQGKIAWVDYVSDVGDGFNATYTVAEAIAADEIPVEGSRFDDGLDDDRAKRAHRLVSEAAWEAGVAPDLSPTQRGEILVMGGDEVYPYASKGAYHRRTVGPYEVALQYLVDVDDAKTSARPAEASGRLRLYAIPGNHDWYDGLSAFLKTFCTKRWVGAWKTEQTRSYFAVRASENLWIWGIDIALGNEIDSPQVAYFEDAANELEPHHSVVLCTAVPVWEKCCDSRDFPGEASNSSLAIEIDRHDQPYENLRWFQSGVIGDRASVPLIISGDHHYYARRTDAVGQGEHGPRHLLTAGGGGAYLSSTRAVKESINVPELDDAVREAEASPRRVDYELARVWPEKKAASKLAWRTAWWQILSTHWFTATVAALYLLLASQTLIPAATEWAVAERELGQELMEPITGPSPSGSAEMTMNIVVEPSTSLLLDEFEKLSVEETAARLAIEALGSFGAWLAFTLMTLGLFLLTHPGGNSRSNQVTKAILAFGHALAHSVALVGVTTLSLWYSTELIAAGYRTFSLYSLVFLLGGVVGTLLFVLYLLIAQHMNVNLNELFSGMRHEGYKNFLRLRVSPEALTVYAFGIEKVGKRPLAWSRNREPKVGGPKARCELIDCFMIPLKQVAQRGGTTASDKAARARSAEETPPWPPPSPTPRPPRLPQPVSESTGPLTPTGGV